MPNVERRLAALERRLHVGLPRLIMIAGGVSTPDGPRFASAGNQRWERPSEEPLPVFEARVMASAAHAKLPFVILGGLGPIESVDTLTFEPTPEDID